MVLSQKAWFSGVDGRSRGGCLPERMLKEEKLTVRGDVCLHQLVASDRLHVAIPARTISTSALLRRPRADPKIGES